MRKRITGIFLAICLIVSFLPATSLAAPVTIDSYGEWNGAVQQWPGDPYGYGFEISAEHGFTWPDAPVTLTIEKNLYVNGTWVIPKNVTVLNHARVIGNLSIAGVWKNEMKQISGTGYQTGSVAGNVTVTDGSRFIAQNNGSNFSDMTVENGGTLTLDTYGSIYVEPGKTLTLASGATVDGTGSIQLAGTLHGEGAALSQSTSITINGRYNGTQANAVISGDITIPSLIRLSSGTLTIPSGSHLTCSQMSVSGSDSGADTEAILQVNGELILTNLMELSGGDTYDAGSARLKLGEEGILHMQPNSEICLNPRGTVTGNGTLKLFAPAGVNGNPYNCPTLVVDYTWPDIEVGLNLALKKGYLADTVTIWKSWTESTQCDHNWVAGQVTEPTCTEEGGTLYTCSKCLATDFRDIKPALGHDPDGNCDCTKDTLCTRCGAILIPAGHQWTTDTSQEGRIICTCSRCKEQTIYELTLKDNIQVEFSSEALTSLTEQALDLGYETILIQSREIAIADLTKAQQMAASSLSDDVKLFDVTLQAVSYDANGNIEESRMLHSFNGTATVRFNYQLPSDMTGRELKACYLAEDGTTEARDVSYESGSAVLTTDHFSTYAVYTAKSSGGSQNPQTPATSVKADEPQKQTSSDAKAVETGDANNMAPFFLLLILSLAAGCTGMAVRKKR